MNPLRLPVLTGAVVALLACCTSAPGATPLPPSAAGPAGSGSEPGFLVRVAQAPEDAAIGNTYQRALRQINGTLTDSQGNAVTNEALPGPNPGGSYNADLASFELIAGQVDVQDIDLNIVASFATEAFPGVPGSGGHTAKFAVEVVGFLDLPAGDTTFGVSVTAERTDVNDDDNYQVFVGVSPYDFFATKVGEYQRNAPGFQNAFRNENQWTVTAPSAGVYPFRLVYWQGTREANLNWYTVTADGERILVNDTANARSVKAYRTSSVARTGAPYIGEVSPPPGSAGNSASAPIAVDLFDGLTALNDASVKLFLNGTQVTPQTAGRTGRRYSLRYDPNATRLDPNNLVRLEYAAAGGATFTNSWSFTINVAGGSAVPVTGQWDFDAGSLAATVGTPLAYLDGPAGLTAAGTKFGTTGQGDFADIANIAGQPAQVMRVPGDLSRSIGYLMTHGIAPNGGGTRVNQFTLIMDVWVAESGPGAASLAQFSSVPANTDDGDLFWQGNNFGQGTDGYRGRGTFTAGAWHRMAAAYDMTASPPVVVKYVNGIKQDDWTTGAALDTPRRTMGPQAILFADGDEDERREMVVNSIQIRAGRLSDAQLALLGGPSAGGIPQSLPESNVTGQWDFAFGDLGATIGTPLAYLDGPGGATETGTQYGTTGEGDFASITNIAGRPARIMRVPGDLSRNIGYLMTHRIAPNGGGTRVNQFTLVMDVFVAESGPGAASLAQFSSVPANTDDGDLFWQGNNFGQGTDGYRGRGTFTAGAWHRMVAAYDMAASPPVVTKYVNGIKQDDWTTGAALDTPRRTMGPQAILFADGDEDERREMWVSSIQIRSGKLTDAQAAALGGPSADGIPVATPQSTVTGQWDFEFGDLGANVGRNLSYLDGTNGMTAAGTRYGVTGVDDFADVPLINGEPARVMFVPGDLSRNIGYLMDHLIPPNGGGTRVNQFTLVLDVMVGTSGPGAAAMAQFSSVPANTDDGDLFWQGNNFGQGTDGYIGTGIFTPGEWHRVVAAYNMAATPPVVVKYVNGIYQNDWTTGAALDAPRRTMGPQAILFADGDEDERREWWVSDVQVRSGALSKPEIEALGGPSAAGIPIVIAAEPPAAAPPELGISRSGSNVTLSWPAGVTGFTLEGTAALPGGWSAVPGVVNNSVTVPAGTGTQYFRLRQ
ncbi:MAG: hypothetical protein ACKVYV_03975 [Limisphaerales bacterium]